MRTVRIMSNCCLEPEMKFGDYIDALDAERLLAGTWVLDPFSEKETTSIIAEVESHEGEPGA